MGKNVYLETVYGDKFNHRCKWDKVHKKTPELGVHIVRC